MPSINVDCYTMAQAAARIGVSKGRVSQYTKEGRLLPIRVGNQLFFDRQQVDSFVRNPTGKPRKKISR